MLGIRGAMKRGLRRLGNLRLVHRDRLHEIQEPEHLGRLLRFLDVDCVFDVGANAGQYARMLRQRAGYQGFIVSFEPIPRLADEASRHAARDGRWEVIRSAIAERDGNVEFNFMQADEYSSMSKPRPLGLKWVDAGNSVARAIEVSSMSLSSAMQMVDERHRFSRPFLKLDTQGCDVRIVQASSAVMYRFVGLQSELAIERLYQEAVDYRSAIAEYEALGFALTALVPNNAGHFPRLLEIDCIMARRDLVSQATDL